MHLDFTRILESDIEEIDRLVGGQMTIQSIRAEGKARLKRKRPTGQLDTL